MVIEWIQEENKDDVRRTNVKEKPKGNNNGHATNASIICKSKEINRTEAFLHHDLLTEKILSCKFFYPSTRETNIIE